MSAKLSLIFVGLVAFFGLSLQGEALPESKRELWSISVQGIDGKEKSLAEYKGKVLLVVNTASQCGFTPQYAGLEALYQKYRERGFVVLGFPSNDFGGQEPGSEAEIKKFCELKYKTTFPLHAKVSIREKPHPLYQELQKTAQVRWNFGKFLVSREGKVLRYFDSKVEPGSKEIAAALEEALGR